MEKRYVELGYEPKKRRSHCYFSCGTPKMKGVPLKEYAKDHQELQKAVAKKLRKMGTKTYT